MLGARIDDVEKLGNERRTWLHLLTLAKKLGREYKHKVVSNRLSVFWNLCIFVCVKTRV